MAEYEEDEEDDDQLPSVDHGPLNEGSWEQKQRPTCSEGQGSPADTEGGLTQDISDYFHFCIVNKHYVPQIFLFS